MVNTLKSRKRLDNVSISGLTLANGYIKGADTTAVSGTNFAVTESGVGLYSLSSGMVNVTDCVITNNIAQGGNATGGTNAYGGDGQGAGIYLGGGTVKLTRCTISNNSSLGGLGMGGTTQTLDGTGRGAGVYKNSGSLTVEDCTIADNITDRIAGSVLSNFTQAQGAGIHNASGVLTVIALLVYVATILIATYVAGKRRHPRGRESGSRASA